MAFYHGTHAEAILGYCPKTALIANCNKKRDLKREGETMKTQNPCPGIPHRLMGAKITECGFRASFLVLWCAPLRGEQT